MLHICIEQGRVMIGLWVREKLRAGKWNGLTEACQQLPERKCIPCVVESQRKGIWMSPVGILTAWDNGTLIPVTISFDAKESFSVSFCCFKNDCRRFARGTKGACIVLFKQSNPQRADRMRERKHFDIKILPKACSKQGAPCIGIFQQGGLSSPDYFHKWILIICLCGASHKCCLAGRESLCRLYLHSLRRNYLSRARDAEGY